MKCEWIFGVRLRLNYSDEYKDDHCPSMGARVAEFGVAPATRDTAPSTSTETMDRITL